MPTAYMDQRERQELPETDGHSASLAAVRVEFLHDGVFGDLLAA